MTAYRLSVSIIYFFGVGRCVSSFGKHLKWKKESSLGFVLNEHVLSGPTFCLTFNISQNALHVECQSLLGTSFSMPDFKCQVKKVTVNMLANDQVQMGTCRFMCFQGKFTSLTNKLADKQQFGAGRKDIKSQQYNLMCFSLNIFRRRISYLSRQMWTFQSPVDTFN